VQIEYRFKDAEEWQAFRPLTWYEPADDEEAMLEPAQHAEQTAAIYFGDAGWTFPQPGEYELRATLKPSEDSVDIVSNVIPIRITAPEADADRAVLQPLLDEQGALDADVGRLLIFGGRIGDDVSHAPIEEAVDEHPATALGSALKLTLASQSLSPPIDPLTGQREQPDLRDADNLLSDTCTDSGIAALKDELLSRFDDDLPPAMTNRLQSSAEAWDGTTRRQEVIPTYSDMDLKPVATSVHFCWNEATLDAATHRAAARTAREIKRANPKRVVVVGHADYEGTCRFNDTLALRRAEVIKQLLARHGTPSSRIQTVSLGERHPLDFSSTEQARQLNRRVEILVETDAVEDEEAPEDQEVARILPNCSARQIP
jgi:outer membrane protein OmpA-like peptidoglycan-associated protein